MEPDPDFTERRFPRVVARVLAVQIASLIGLWLLSLAFGAP